MNLGEVMYGGIDLRPRDLKRERGFYLHGGN